MVFHTTDEDSNAAVKMFRTKHIVASELINYNVQVLVV